MASNPQSERRQGPSAGGKARAQKLSKEERSRQAREAARARWRGLRQDGHVHLALETGVLELAGLSFSCAVLDDGTRVVSGTEFMARMGIYRSGALSTRRYADESGI